MSILDITEDEILALVTPVAMSMQEGWDNNNYEQFSEYFSGEMKNEVNIESFETQRNDLIPELGKHLEMEFVATHKNPDNVIVIWRLSFSNREMPALLTYTFEEGESGVNIAGAMLQT